jgi:predicted enzyme related to lactoylglutathione lyase
MKYGMVDTAEGPASINGGVGRSHDRHVSVYAQVEDLQATLDRVERLGGKTVRSAHRSARRPQASDVR